MKVWYLTGDSVPEDAEVFVVSGRYRFLPDPRWHDHENGPRYVGLFHNEEGIIETDNLAAVSAFATILGVEK